MSEVRFKFIERLGSNLNLSNTPIANGDRIDIAIGKLQGQITNIPKYTFNNSNGVTFGTNGSIVTASVNTTYAGSNHTHGNPTLALTNLSGSTSSNSNGLTLSISAQNQSQLVFSNSNNVTFGINASTLTASFSQSNETNKAGIGFTGTNISGTINSNGIILSVANPSAGGTGADGGVYLSAGTNSRQTGNVIFSNSNGVSFGMNTGGIVTAKGGGAISAGTDVATGGTVVFSNSNGVSFGLSANVVTAKGGGAISAGSQIATGGTVVFSNANGVSFGLNSNTLTASLNQTINIIGNTLGNAQLTGNNVYFSAGAGVMLSATGNTLVLSADGAPPRRYYVEINNGEGLTTIRQLSETMLRFRPMFFPFWVDGTGVIAKSVRFFVSGGASSNRSLGMTLRLGLYSMINESQMTLLATDSMGYSISASSQSSQWNGPAVMDFTGMSNYTMTAEGRYALALHVSNVSANVSWAQMALYGCDNYPSFSRVLMGGTTQATNQSNQLIPYQGVFSATTTALPTIINKSHIFGGNSASALQPYAIIMGI
jgi:hypothetical protein